ncbi:uncharacterized protein I303_103970 [Kwoniella dejecticola CBS 10117]|uniref:Uncharacterized protein n=1 Tax=Kwoniella dejecticola CBS 10117 TaxID=1296121 RepID=A0A1A6A880_9TREE|nr:uncharacterized protein I303_03987 [Kwoniella dejecticola CBS 10117]OBR86265.1 hypothetical protein I303_03987 [Kwoniella dejecticola CBS 10117]
MVKLSSLLFFSSIFTLSTTAENKAPYQSKISVQNSIPNYTRSILQRDHNSDFLGPHELAWTWNATDLQSLDQDEWLQEPVTWLIYDRGADMRDPQDDDIIFNLTCYYEISKECVGANEILVNQTIGAPFLSLPDSTQPQDVLTKGNVICPEGRCIAKDCTGLEVPTFDREDLIRAFKNPSS